MKYLVCIIFCSFLVQNVFAQENCIAMQANKYAASGVYVFKQYAFEKSQDLVIITPQAEIKRVTFGRRNASTSCFFQPLAFAQGGDWGWHLLWAEAGGGLFYARMDGEAWVSSNPKRLTTLAPIMPHFKLDGQNIVLSWQQVENGVTSNIQAVSDDEGRNWVISTVQP